MRIIFITLFLIYTYMSNAQNLTLEKAIQIANENSVDAAIAKNRLNNAYWTYRTYRADQLPEIIFSGAIPSYNLSYQNYLQENGNNTFIPVNNIAMNGKISVTQQVGFTGGTLSLNSSLNFNRTFNTAYNSFMSIPFALTYTQPLLGVNRFKWNSKIEPIRYKESSAQYTEDLENVTLRTISIYFNWLLATSNLNTATQNLQNADKLHTIAVAKRKIGQISESDLMQLELSALQAKAVLTEATSQLNANLFQVKSFLGIDDDTLALVPIVPGKLPSMKMEYDFVVEKSLTNNPFAHNIIRRQLEADYAVAEAQGNRRSINLYATIGYTGMDSKFSNSYSNLNNNQVAEIGVTLPILDWGKRKGKVMIAESNREVISQQIRQDEMNFKQEIFLLVENFNNQADQLEIAAQADIIALKRYETSIETFLMGKTNVLDLNDAQSRKDMASQTYIQQIYLYWSYFYQIRRLTLYDFIENKDINVTITSEIKN